jgi:phenylpyruvate tautomerase PptA (4-oxalocrotonate tautomerase family)
MPLYNLACRADLDPATREKIAQAVTQTHVAVTGAPAAFVNVLFVNNYPLDDALWIDAIGGVRKGGTRTAEVVDKLRNELQQAIAAAAHQSVDRVKVTLIGIPSNWVMEGGEVMPDPGAEAEWLARRAAETPP